MALMLLGSANAASGDYRFELVGHPVVSGGNDIIRVRLIHLPDAKPVSGTPILESRMDMQPVGMATMTAPVATLPGSDGFYVFEVSPVMAGRWALHLTAKVQGGHQTIRQTLLVDLSR